MRKLKAWFAAQAQHRKEDFINNKPITMPVRLLGASIPIIAFVIVVWAVFSTGNDQRIIASTDVNLTKDWLWEVQQFDPKQGRRCVAKRCWQQLDPISQRSNLDLPFGDPVAAKVFNPSRGGLFVYTTSQTITSPQVLYLPGIQAEHVSIFVNRMRVIRSTGNLPYFVDLEPRNGAVEVEIATIQSPEKKNLFQGFISKQFFIGPTLNVYRTHSLMQFRGFPRYAVVIYLLAIGALTFAFFLFMDHKRELFALGLTLSLLGAAFAVRTGVLSFLGPPAFFTFFVLHIAALIWYTGELIRLSTGVPKVSIGFGVGMVALYVAIKLGLGVVGKPYAFLLLLVADGVPIGCGAACLLTAWVTMEGSRERALQLAITAVGMVLYGLYLYADDVNLGYSALMKSMSEVPLLVVVSTWVVAALASLGSLERRVQIAVEDREQRQKLEHDVLLAQEVQKSFISIGMQDDPNFEVCTVYQAFKKVGGDWVIWRSLNDEYSIGIVGDVVGKGIQAGLIVSASDSILRNVLQDKGDEDLDPVDLVRTVVRNLFYSVIQPHEGRAMTLMVAVLSRQGRLHYTTLGHPPMLAVSPRKTRAIQLRHSWLNPEFDLDSFKTDATDIAEDETLICYTDGICDGSRELRQFLRRVKDWHSRELMSISDEFTQEEPTYDDQTLFLLRRRRQVGKISA